MCNKQFLYVGTYTRPEAHLKSANGRGVYLYSLDLTSGLLTFCSLVADIVNPSYLSLDEKNRSLFAVSEVEQDQPNGVSSFKIAEDGTLTRLSTQPSMGSGACYLTITENADTLLLANYGSGNIASYPITENSLILAASYVNQHLGEGPNKERQEAAHAHSIVINNDSSLALAADLGTDQLYAYKVLENSTLEYTSSITMPAGSGPRHIAFHCDNQHAFVVNELSNQISVLTFNKNMQLLTVIEHHSTLPDTALIRGESWAGDIHITPNGRFVYVSNRGDDSIAIFEFLPSLAKLNQPMLKLVGFEATLGEFPRGFVIDSSGQYLLVANQNSDNIVSFAINQHTGALSKIAEIAAPTPVCLQLLSEH